MNSNGAKRCGHHGDWDCSHSPAHVNNVMVHVDTSTVTWVPELLGIELIDVVSESEYWVQRNVSDADFRAMEHVGLFRVSRRHGTSWSADARLFGETVLPPVLIVQPTA